MSEKMETYYSDELLEEMKIRINNLDVRLKKLSDLLKPIYCNYGKISGVSGRHGLPIPFSLVDLEMNSVCNKLHNLETCMENIEFWIDKDLLKTLGEESKEYYFPISY